MEGLTQMTPSIQVAHHYRFPSDRNTHEATRVGYCYAFHLVDSGKGRISIPGRTYDVKKGDLLYFPPRLAHSFYTDPVHPLSTYNVYCELWGEPRSVHLPTLVWNEAEFDPGLLTTVRTGTALDQMPVFLPLQRESSLNEQFARIVRRHQAKDDYSQTIAASLLKAFILEAVEASRIAEPIDFRIKSIVERIDKEANAAQRGDSWLAGTGLRKTQFHELFKQATGMSPKAYLTYNVMKQAAAALSESKRSVTEIAEDLGYSSIHHFTKQFTVYFGSSPTAYRRRRK
ncbi:MAG: helix-turn-helix transcriptional regulator [Paenibacillaceae bacterium]|nr:helix-turn-helix transcriptional regulator [Paenibacillaceae bacterium]